MSPLDYNGLQLILKPPSLGSVIAGKMKPMRASLQRVWCGCASSGLIGVYQLSLECIALRKTRSLLPRFAHDSR